uniref:FecR family protein n=1 Tax=Pedobacter schmidteae TaxID=2201271 RepID=UPI000EB422EB|nr:FecR family protein [Pedobacter schmidteae]
MKNKQAKSLLNRHRKGQTSLEERAALESWYNHQAEINPGLKDDTDFAKALDEMDQAFPFAELQSKSVKVYSWRLVAAAAAVLFCLGTALYFYSHKTTSEKTDRFAGDVKPGGNRAFLTLSDGSKISLTDAANGELARQANISITKAKDGQLVYEVKGAEGNDHKTTFNTIETPRGGQYQIKLPDGTIVWLNASSVLRYPTVFTGSSRTVELKGEAYFEVAKSKYRTFKVKSGLQELQVLGTHFNVSAYIDDIAVKTTLLEGSVMVSGNNTTGGAQDVVLKPGQQSSFSARGLRVSLADTEESVAWKNGYFKFNDEHIESILKKVSRWYDTDIEYEGKMTDKIFNGKISRYSNVSKVLELLELTGAIHFKIEGRRIIAMP